MAAIIKHKRSAVASAQPIPAGLAEGEIALNTADVKLFFKNAADQVIAINDWDNIFNKPAEPYDIGATTNGSPTASLVLLRYPFPRAVTFPAGMLDSQGVAIIAATAQTDFDILKNGVSFGTMRFAASATTATFIAASSTSFVAGDVLSVVAPATPDVTLSNIGFSLAGVR